MALTRQKFVTELYSGGSSSDILQDAYEKAVRYFELELTQDHEKRAYVLGHHSFSEVVDLAQRARETYSMGGGKVQRWTLALSERIMFYGQVLDALSQHHPEYVALAWGATKFVLQGILNHAEMVSEFAKAMSEISDVLPRVEANSRLYPTDRMRDLITEVYAQIMHFLCKAVKWYRRNPFQRALLAVWKPWPLSYRGIVERIQSLTATIDANASTASRAELRDVSVTLRDHDTKLEEIDDMLQFLVQCADERRGQMVTLLQTTTEHYGLGKSHYSLSQGISKTLDEHTERLCSIQYTQILFLLKPKRAPDTVLETGRSIARRRALWNQPTQDSQNFVQCLQKWSSTPGSSMFVVRAGLRAEARTKDLAIDVVTTLQKSGFSVIWYFSERSADGVATVIDVLKTLVYQVLSYDQSVIKADPNLMDASKFQGARTETEWVDCLVYLLARVSKCFLIVETQAMYEKWAGEGSWSVKLEQLFQDIVDKVEAKGVVLKILLVSYGTSKIVENAGSEKRITTYIRHNPISPARARMLTGRRRIELSRHLKKPGR